MKVLNGNIILSDEESKDTIRYDNVDYILKELNEEYSRSKRGNSKVFLLTDPQKDKKYVIKISKYDIEDKDVQAKHWDRIARFEKEITALNTAKENKSSFVVQIIFDGSINIGKRSFRYLVMEKADYDLKEYLKETEICIQQRFLACTQILSGLKELHSMDIYHRDIKPDNILSINEIWKIGDLGLVANREDDFTAKEIGMKIGPANWMSPEAFNKMYNEEGENIHNFDCNLDERSDIFQLGKLFWFILQGNIPDGQLIRDDFKVKDDQLFKVLYNMLSHSKKNRPLIEDVEAEFKERYPEYKL